MGFSVSGSAAIIFVSMFIAFGMWHAAASSSFERVTDAQQADTDAALEARNTHLSITNASYLTGSNAVEVNVTNDGASQLRLDNVDVLVDGAYVDGWQSAATVVDAGDTDLWLAGDKLTVTLSGYAAQPDRVKVVAGTGVAAAAEVTGA